MAIEWQEDVDGVEQARGRLVVRGELREHMAMMRLEMMYRVEGLLELALTKTEEPQQQKRRGRGVREKRGEVAALVDLMTAAEHILADEQMHMGANAELTKRCMSVWWKVLNRFEALLRKSGTSTGDAKRIVLAMGKLEKLMRAGEARDHARANGDRSNEGKRDEGEAGDGGGGEEEALERIREEARRLSDAIRHGPVGEGREPE